MSDETILNQEILDQITNAKDGDLTKVGSAGTTMIREFLREDGFLRKIFTPETVTNAELDYVIEHDRPVKFIEFEPTSKGAMTVPFNATAEAQMFYGRKGVVDFFPVKTPRFTKNINELRTYRNDIRKIITENAIKDLQTKEDGLLVSLCDTIVGAYNGTGVSGKKQHFKAGDGTGGTVKAINGGLSDRSTFVEMKKALERFRLNNGVFLMNRVTAKEFEKMDRIEIGGDLSENIFKDGLRTMGEAKILGVPLIFTIKDDLVPDGVVYAFTEPDFLGKFYVLQEPTMYVKKEEDIITVSASEVIGLTIGNVAGVVKFDLNVA